MYGSAGYEVEKLVATQKEIAVRTTEKPVLCLLKSTPHVLSSLCLLPHISIRFCYIILENVIVTLFFFSSHPHSTNLL